MALLEALRHGVENLDWREDGLRVTLSGGISTNQIGMKEKDIIKLADELVYKAKKDGKNRIYCIEMLSKCSGV